MRDFDRGSALPAIGQQLPDGPGKELARPTAMPDFLIRHIGRNENKVAGVGLRHELQMPAVMIV
jgi:hypothetical protein